MKNIHKELLEYKFKNKIHDYFLDNLLCDYNIITEKDTLIVSE